jgi:hypothetical protein
VRALNSKQKEVLIKEIGSNKGIYMYEDLSMEVKEQLDNLNDFETIIEEVNRFLWDYNTQKELAKRISKIKML